MLGAVTPADWADPVLSVVSCTVHACIMHCCNTYMYHAFLWCMHVAVCRWLWDGVIVCGWLSNGQSHMWQVLWADEIFHFSCTKKIASCNTLVLHMFCCMSINLCNSTACGDGTCECTCPISCTLQDGLQQGHVLINYSCGFCCSSRKGSCDSVWKILG